MNIRVTLNDFLENIKKALESVVERGTNKTSENGVLSGKEELDRSLSDIEKAYAENPYRTYDGRTVVELQEIDYKPLGDDEIYKIAEEKVKEQKAATEKQLAKTAEEKVKAYEKSKIKTLEDADASIAKLAKSAAAAKQDAENQALKRGIGRSSIIMEELGGIDRSAIEGSGEIYAAAQKRIAEIDDSILTLRGELSDALDKLDLDSAVKINDEVKKLESEREEKIAETAKYNNSVREKNASNRNYLAKNGIEASEEDSDEYRRKTNEKIKKLYEYYYSLGNDAKESFEKDKEFIVSHVGESGYAYLENLLSK